MMEMNASEVNDHFTQRRDGALTLWLRKGEEEALLKRGISAPEKLLRTPAGRAVRGRGGAISIPLDELQPGGKRILLRSYAHGGVLGELNRHLFLDVRRPLRELALALHAERSGVNTARALAVVIRHIFGPFHRAYFVSEEITGSEDLVHFARRCAMGEVSHSLKRDVLRAAAREIRRMHDVGIFHGDLHLKNLLVQLLVSGAQPKVYVIDFDLARRYNRLSTAERLRNLARLARSVRKIRWAARIISSADALRFLIEYWNGILVTREELRRWLRRLTTSGRTHQLWWRLTGAEREIAGDAAN